MRACFVNLSCAYMSISRKKTCLIWGLKKIPNANGAQAERRSSTCRLGGEQASSSWAGDHPKCCPVSNWPNRVQPFPSVQFAGAHDAAHQQFLCRSFPQRATWDACSCWWSQRWTDTNDTCQTEGKSRLRAVQLIHVWALRWRTLRFHAEGPKKL